MTGFHIERKTTNGTFAKIAQVAKNTEDYANAGLLADTAYTYRVRAYAGDRFSDYSAEAAATTFKPSNAAPPAEPPAEPPVIPPGPTVEPEPETKPESPPISPAKPTPKPPAKTFLTELQETLKLNLETPLIQNTAAVLQVVGLLTGMAAATAATAVPFFPITPLPFVAGFANFFSLFGFIGRSKRKSGWGIVFDAETRQPIAGAVVSIFNQEGDLADSVTTDAEGRYGFLAKDGVYTLQAAKDNYTLKKDDRTDEFYGDIYTGEALTVRWNTMIKMNLALQVQNINWKEFARRKIAAYTSVFSIIKKDACLILFYAGFLTTAAILYFSPFLSIWNVLILTLYITLALYQIFFKTRNFGIISNQSRQPVPFSMLSLYDARYPGRRVAFTVSDVLGRYYFLIADGLYDLKVQGQELDGRTFNQTRQVYAEKGIIKEDVVVG